MVDRTWDELICHAVTLVVFIILGMTVMNNKNLNQELSDEIQQTTTESEEFRNKMESCSKQLEAKSTDIDLK